MELPLARTWWIEPGKIIGGRYPGTGNPAESRQMLDTLLAAGVRVFVNLQQANELGRGGIPFPDYRPVIEELANEREITVASHRFPIPDMGVPDHTTMAAIQDALHEAVDAGSLVYVHCWGGHGRTGTVGGCWLVSSGITPKDAFKLMKDRRAHDAHLAKESAPQTTEQRQMVESWAGLGSKPQPKSVTLGSKSNPSHDSFRNRAIGALVGLAVGDAVGTTLEFKPPGTFKPLVDLVGGGPFNLKAGEWTDDTSMALCLAESLVKRGFFDPIDQLQRYVRWWKEGYFSVKGHCFDIGNQVSAALSDFISSGKPFCGPTGTNNAGNGSLMRLAPVAIAYATAPSAAIVHAAQSSRTTYGNQECVAACRYFGGLLVGAIRGESKANLLNSVYSPVAGLWDHEPLQPKVAAIAVGSFKQRKPPEIRGTGYVIDCLEAALWAFHTTDSFEAAILLAANLGDDADTTAAVCGQIAGAHYGLSGIPSKWFTKLAQRDVILGLADSLLQIMAHEG